ncbi:hypothetical protein HKD37_18G051609 [Glycine soja]
MIFYRWKLLIPKNVAVFIWRVSLERLPMMDNLAKRWVALPMEELSCPFCQEVDETLKHVMFTYKFATKRWNLCYNWLGIRTELHNISFFNITIIGCGGTRTISGRQQTINGNLRSTDAAHHRRVLHQTRTGHACTYDSGTTRCPSPPPSLDTVEQEDTRGWTRPTTIPLLPFCVFSLLFPQAPPLLHSAAFVSFPVQVTVAKLTDLKKIDNEATLRVERSKTKFVSLPPVSTQHQMDTNTLETLDHEIARMFYFSGLHFHLARNPHYMKEFAYAANNQISGYQPPALRSFKRLAKILSKHKHLDNEGKLELLHMMSNESDRSHPASRSCSPESYTAIKTWRLHEFCTKSGIEELFCEFWDLSVFVSHLDGTLTSSVGPETTLLQNERRHVENFLQLIKNAWSQKGVSIVSDGWSDPQRRSLINFMVVTESGPMFLKAIDCSNEIKDKDFIAKHMREVIMEVGHSNVVQIVTDNATVCKAEGLIIEAEFPSIYWTPCVVHTLNLALKNICAAKNTEKNNVAYEECSWITQIADDAMFVKNFVMSHSMRLSIFNSFNSLKLLSISPTRFASTIVMLKRFKQLKKGLQEMVISDQWSSYKEDDVAMLDDKWWDKVDYILSFTSLIYDVLRRTDTEASSLHLVYEMWDSMTEKVKNAIYQYERKEESEGSTFYEVVHSILIDRWTKSSTPLHCLAHSLNPRYYSHEWLSEDSNQVPPHQDMELTRERLKCFKRFFLDVDVRRKVNIEFANFSDGREGFDDLDSLNDKGQMDPKAWWLVYGINAPILQKIALKLLVQPCSSSCYERNWSTYSFIHSLKRNKMAPHRVEELETKMWDVAGDDFGSLDDYGILEIASLSLDEPELEVVFVSYIFNISGVHVSCPVSVSVRVSNVRRFIKEE